MVFYTFIPIPIEHSVSKKWKPDQTMRSAASGLGLHCFFSMSRKEDARINYFEMFFGGHVQSLKVIFNSIINTFPANRAFCRLLSVYYCS